MWNYIGTIIIDILLQKYGSVNKIIISKKLVRNAILKLIKQQTISNALKLRPSILIQNKMAKENFYFNVYG